MSQKLIVKKLSKKYGSFTALESTDLILNAGEIATLSGKNGSGKTTLLTCIASLVRPTSGAVQIEGFDFYRDEVEFRRRLAFVPDTPRFYIELTAWEHLRFIAMANKILDGFSERAESLLENLGLWRVRHDYPHHYSRGMQLKLGLALALIRPFEVLLLDEPTSALDRQSLEVLLEKLQELKREGVSILMSSHDPHLIQDLGDRHFEISQGMLGEV